MQKILVIDDDSLVRDTLVRILERKSYQVLVAPNGARGLQMFRSEQPDLVITDIIMPDKEGSKQSEKSAVNVPMPKSLQSPAAPASTTWIFSKWPEN